MDKYTLIPSAFFRSGILRESLGQMYPLDVAEEVNYTELPSYGAVLVFAVPAGAGKDYRPAVYSMLKALPHLKDVNKVAVSYSGGWLHLCVAQGDSLLLANSYRADDFVTAQYFIFAVLNQFHFNPGTTSLYFSEKLDIERQEALLEYFRSVEVIPSNIL